MSLSVSNSFSFRYWMFLYTSSLPKEKAYLKRHLQGFPGGTMVKNLPANAGDTGSIPGPGRSHMPQSN